MLRKLIFLMTLAWLAACSREEAPAEVEKAVTATGDSPFLAYIPADTPYFFATRQALDEKTALEMVRLSGYNRASLKAQIQEMRAAAGSDAARFFDMADAILDEVGEFGDPAGYARIGTKPNAHAAFYGIGLAPVLRVEIADRARFSSFVDRILEITELEPARLPHGDRSLLRFDAGPGAVLMSIGDSDFVATAVPADAEAKVIARLLGDTVPDRNLADAGILIALEREHGFGPFMLGRIDSAHLLREFERPSLPLIPDHDASEIFDGAHCREELDGIAKRFPGMVVGTRRFDTEVMDLRLLFLTDADMAADLATLPAAVPGMGSDRGLMGLGFGMQLPKLASLFSKWAGAMSATPYACEHLAGLNQMATGLRQAAANPGLLMAGPAASGVHLRLDRLSIENITEPDFAGVLTLASPNPQALLAMGSNFLPPLASLNVTPGGDAVPMPADLMQGPMRSAFIALDDKAIALAVNSDDGAAASSALSASTGDSTMMFHMYFRSELYTLFADAIEKMEMDDPQMTRLAGDLRRYAGLLESGEIAMRTTDKGVEFGVVSRMR